MGDAMTKFANKLYSPFYCLFVRPLRTRNLRNFYYAVFKYRSFKLLFANDFTTKDASGTHLQYYYKHQTRFPHPVGIVIGHKVKLGMNCTIYQNVTIGNSGRDSAQPTLGNNVTIYANAVVIGSIHIGDNAIVGANSVVTADVPANSTVVGSPARVLSK